MSVLTPALAVRNRAALSGQRGLPWGPLDTSVPAVGTKALRRTGAAAPLQEPPPALVKALDDKPGSP